MNTEPKSSISTEYAKVRSGFYRVASTSVRVTDKVTGLSVMSDSERSQYANKHTVWEELEALIAKEINKITTEHNNMTDHIKAIEDAAETYA